MSFPTLMKCGSLVFLAGSLCSGQTAAPTASSLSFAPQTTLPISFSKALSAASLKTGDVVVTKTIQQVRLTDGRVLGSGTEVLGHVVEAASFHYDKTPYAKQKQGVLTIKFDEVRTKDGDIPLRVSVRAIADRFASDAAGTPRPSDEDPLHSTTQVGGDIVTPSQNEIINRDGDTVGYNKRGGNFAHLIASGSCDGSNTEQPVSIFSASACGVYGFAGMTMSTSGSTVSFVSTHRSPEIPRYSTALLEVQADTTMAAAR